MKKQQNKDSLFKPTQHEGQYANDKRHGKGMLTLMNGDRLLGNFRQGYIDGFVKYVTTQGETKYGQYTNGQRQSWLHGKQLQAVLGKEAAKSKAADVFSGQATGADVRRAKREAEAQVHVQEHRQTQPFNIHQVHTNAPQTDDLRALEERRATRRKRQASTQ